MATALGPVIVRARTAHNALPQRHKPVRSMRVRQAPPRAPRQGCSASNEQTRLHRLRPAAGASEVPARAQPVGYRMYPAWTSDMAVAPGILENKDKCRTSLRQPTILSQVDGEATLF